MKIFEQSEEKEIIQKVLDGDSNSFRLLLEKYQAYVFKIVSSHIPNNKVEEIAHEVFIKMYKSLPNYEFKSELKHWISTIAVRTCYDYWRKNSKVKELPLTSFMKEAPEWVDNDSESVYDALQFNMADSKYQAEMNQQDARDFLDRALSNLSAEDRMVLTLVHLDGYSVDECSELLGWSPSKVKTRAHRSRQKLRQFIEKSQSLMGVKS